MGSAGDVRAACGRAWVLPGEAQRAGRPVSGCWRKVGQPGAARVPAPPRRRGQSHRLLGSSGHSKKRTTAVAPARPSPEYLLARRVLLLASALPCSRPPPSLLSAASSSDGAARRRADRGGCQPRHAWPALELTSSNTVLHWRRRGEPFRCGLALSPKPKSRIDSQNGSERAMCQPQAPNASTQLCVQQRRHAGAYSSVPCPIQQETASVAQIVESQPSLRSLPSARGVCCATGLSSPNRPSAARVVTLQTASIYRTRGCVCGARRNCVGLAAIKRLSATSPRSPVIILEIWSHRNPCLASHAQTLPLLTIAAGRSSGSRACLFAACTPPCTSEQRRAELRRASEVGGGAAWTLSRPNRARRDQL